MDISERDKVLEKYGRLTNARGQCQCMYCINYISQVYHQCLNCHIPSDIPRGHNGYCIHCGTGQFHDKGIEKQLPRVLPSRNHLAKQDHQLFDLLKVALDCEGQLHIKNNLAMFRHRTGKLFGLGLAANLSDVHAKLLSIYVLVRNNPLVAELDDDSLQDVW